MGFQDFLGGFRFGDTFAEGRCLGFQGGEVGGRLVGGWWGLDAVVDELLAYGAE